METVARFAIAAGACLVVLLLLVLLQVVAYRVRRPKQLARLEQLKQERGDSDDAREQFIAWFVDRGVRASAAGAVYDYLQRRCDVSDFPIRPDDLLQRDFDLVVHEEIDDILHELGYRALDESEWEVLDWDALKVPPPSEPDAPVAALVYLVDALGEGRGVPDVPAGETS